MPARQDANQYLRDRLADAAIHTIAVLAACAGAVCLVAVLPKEASFVSYAAITLYAAGLLLTFICSALYNLTIEKNRKMRLRRFDHAAIFVMIAGTYTPVALLAIGGAVARWFTGAIWAGALCGAALKFVAHERFEQACIAAYLILGWIGLAAFDTLLAALPGQDLAFLGVGGLLYSAGVLVHLSKRLPYQAAIWHALVTVAACCHYAVIFRLAARAP